MTREPPKRAAASAPSMRSYIEEQVGVGQNVRRNVYGAGVSGLQGTGGCQALSRHDGVPGCQVLDPDDVEFPPVSAHLVDDVTVGRQGGVRLRRAKKARQIDGRRVIDAMADGR